MDLRQSTASQEIPLGYFVDSVDGNTEKTGLTIANTDIKIHKTGATTLASKNSGGATHISNGLYYAVLDATDTDTIGSLILFCHVAGALPVRLECRVLDETVYDALYGTVALATATNITAAAGIAVASIGAGVITATSIASDAITDAKVASDVTIASVTGAVGSIASGGISAASFAAGAIDNAAIATDAIGSAELASSAVTEIQSGLATSSALATAQSSLDGIAAKTTNLPTDPADASDIASSFSTVNGKLDAIDDYVDTEVAAIKAKTDQLTFTVTNKLDATLTSATAAGLATLFTVDTTKEYTDAIDGSVVKEIAANAGGSSLTEEGIADAVLNRDFDAVDDTNSRTALNALRAIRNKVSTTAHAGELTVYKENDSTEAWRATLTTDGSAEPITGVDPD